MVDVSPIASTSGPQKMEIEQKMPPPPVPRGGKKKDIKVDEQILLMNNERITVPELLFNPSDIGIMQAGVVEAIVQAVNCCHVDMHGLLYSNILLMGGNTLFSGFKTRLETELRTLVPQDFDVNIYETDDPIRCAWRGGSKFSLLPNYNKFVVTKAEYEESGNNICRRRFTVP